MNLNNSGVFMEYIYKYDPKIGIIYMKSDGYYLTGLYFKDSNDEQKHRGNAEYKDLPIFKKQRSS